MYSITDDSSWPRPVLVRAPCTAQGETTWTATAIIQFFEVVSRSKTGPMWPNLKCT